MRKLLLIATLICTGAVVAPAERVNAAPSDSRKKAVRTLEAITIEGEIAVPQVLFITSRDYRRYRDGLGSKFRMSTLDVARSVDRPTRLSIVAKSGQNKEAGK